MSESVEEDDAPKPFSALSYEGTHDPGTLSLSDSDPALSDGAEVESVSDEEEDDEEEHRQEGGHESPLQPFSLKGTDAGFSQRSHGIFGALLDVQKGSSLSQYSIKEKQGVTCSSAPEVPAFDQKETTTSSSNTGRSKRPAPASRLPDYLAHPERWTKYSLEDVPDTTDRGNRNTALNFLAELKQQKRDKEAANPRSYNQDASSSGEGRILFKKPQKRSLKDEEKSGAQPGQQQLAGSWGDDGLEDDGGLGDQTKSESLEFHGAKKRIRKNIRQKADDKEEEDSS